MLIELTAEEIDILAFCVGIEYGHGTYINGVDCGELRDRLRGLLCQK